MTILLQDVPGTKLVRHLKNGHMPSLLKVIKEEAKRARHNPAVLASFRALRLNMGLRPVNVSHVCSPEDWQQAEGIAEPTGAICFRA